MNIKELHDIKITPLLDTLQVLKLSDEEYFSSKYKDYVSNSRLSLIDPNRDGSPEKFFKGFQSTYNSSFLLGSAVHQLCLQPERYKLAEGIDRPTAKLGLLADKLYDICKGDTPNADIINSIAKVVDYYNGNLNDKQINNVLDKCKDYWLQRRLFESTYDEDKELIYLDLKMSETVLNCVREVFFNKYFQELLYPTAILQTPESCSEQAILLDLLVNDQFIIHFKAKVDNYYIDFDENKLCVNDLKTVSNVVSKIEENIVKFSYHREIAIYSWLLCLYCKKRYNMNPIVSGNYLVVSTIPGYYTKVRPLSKKDFIQGFNEFKYLIRLVAYYISKGYEY